MSVLLKKNDIWLDLEPEFSQKNPAWSLDENLDLKTVKIVVFRKNCVNKKIMPNYVFCGRFTFYN